MGEIVERMGEEARGQREKGVRGKDTQRQQVDSSLLSLLSMVETLLSGLRSVLSSSPHFFPLLIPYLLYL